MVLVSVLLPVYNGELFLESSIRSVLNQTFTDFELVIINDGSSDQSENIISSFNDTRIVYKRNRQNLGLIATLNYGLTLCRGKYILRMDADDIMYPNRIFEQFKFMEQNPDIVASGTSIKRFGAKTGIYHPPVSDSNIREILFLGSPIPHPTAIIRKCIIDRFELQYNSNYLHVEDYKFWYDLSKYGRLANMRKCLLLYRVSASQISTKYFGIQIEHKNKVRREIFSDYLKDLGVDFPECFDIAFIQKVKLKCRLFKGGKEILCDELLPIVLFVSYLSISKYTFSFFSSLITDIPLLGLKYSLAIGGVLIGLRRNTFYLK